MSSVFKPFYQVLKTSQIDKLFEEALKCVSKENSIKMDIVYITELHNYSVNLTGALDMPLSFSVEATAQSGTTKSRYKNNLNIITKWTLARAYESLSKKEPLDLENDAMFTELKDLMRYYLNKPWTTREICLNFKKFLGEEEPYKPLAMELWANYVLVPFLSFVSNNYGDYSDSQTETVITNLKTGITELKAHPELVIKCAIKIPVSCIPVFCFVAELSDAEEFRQVFSVPATQKQRICDKVKGKINEYVALHPGNENLKQVLQDQLQALISSAPTDKL